MESLLSTTALQIFKNDYEYNKIKEKIIGKEIKYIPDIEKAFDNIISNKKFDNVRAILKKYKNGIVSEMEYQNCFNIRTLKYFLDEVTTLILEIEKYNLVNLNNYENIIWEIIQNLLREIIKYKNGENINWNERQRFECIIGCSRFKFVSDYIIVRCNKFR